MVAAQDEHGHAAGPSPMPHLAPEAAAALRDAGDLSHLWGSHQFGCTHPDVRLRLEALPGPDLFPSP